MAIWCSRSHRRAPKSLRRRSQHTEQGCGDAEPLISLRPGAAIPPGRPCFIVTHTVPQEWVKEGSPFTFVTDGVESAIRQARQAAGDKDVVICTASILQQCLKAGLVDEIHIDVAPVLLGGGVRLFDNLGTTPIELERIRVIEAPGVTHLGFRVVK